MSSNLLAEELSRDLFILEDENNPNTSKVNKIYPNTILDQVFDQLSPSRRNLREILADLKQEIITGGLGNIIFPVTSVNNKLGDIKIDKVFVGLENVDNTSDISKPLSVPQRDSIMDILSHYNFNLNLNEIYNHVNNLNNPHQVTFEQIDVGNHVSNMMENITVNHNLDRNSHTDIRRNLSRLWLLTENITKDVDVRIGVIIDTLNEHILDIDPHSAQMILKEDKINKTLSFEEGNVNHTKYPTTAAVYNHVSNSINTFKENIPNLFDWISSIGSVEKRSDLPVANSSNWKKAFFIRLGERSEGEFAVCKKNPNETFSWDIFSTGNYSKFNSNLFIDTDDGMSLNMDNLISTLFGPGGVYNTSLDQILSSYYTSQYLNDNFLREVTIIPGTMDGNIRYYINKDQTTMSDEIRITGLKKYAFMNTLDEHDIHPLSISNQHLQSRSVNNRCIDGRAVAPDNLQCRHGFMLGNTNYPNTSNGHEVTLIELANYLRPLIGGWPDPNIPGGSPWNDALTNAIASPHLYTPGLEHSFTDHSYLIRFTGTISCIPNYLQKTLLTSNIKLGPQLIIGAGGSWVYQSEPKLITILGGSNITGHTFGTINIDKSGLYFESISIGDRMEAPYDIWVKYVKPDELAKLSIPGYLEVFVEVTDIYNIPTRGDTGTPLPLTGNVIPSNATHQTIVWSINPGSTALGATIDNNRAICQSDGYVNLKATIVNGTAYGTNFEKDISIYFS